VKAGKSRQRFVDDVAPEVKAQVAQALKTAPGH